MRSAAYPIIAGAFAALPGIIFGVATGQWGLALLFSGAAVPICVAGVLTRRV